MLSLGLTGGIAAGKSLLSTRFRELGAIVIDADQLARDVVAPGTVGLAAVVDHFGAEVLLPDGSLNRAALGVRVFSNKAELAALNAITHPLVRAAAAALHADAGPDAIVVQDIPLLVESGQGPNFHLVVVAQAPSELRIERMIRDRGMSREDALARMAAQATDEERAAVADVVIVNDGSRDEVIAVLDGLWHERLLPFALNLAAGRAHGGTSDDDAAGTARLLARLKHAVGESAVILALRPDAAGPAFRVEAADGVSPGTVLEALAGAGYFPVADAIGDATILASADPGQPARISFEA
ncbi:dephospho-CoA kinase [Arthrobacter sp. Sr24]